MILYETCINKIRIRWNVDTRTIDKWEQNKVIQRIEGIPAPRYSMEHIQKIEGIKNINQFSPLERRRLENELDKLRVENEKLKSVISRILAESAKIIDM